jgi:hypothetical protein
LAGLVQGWGAFFAAIHHDPLSGNAHCLLSSHTAAGTFLLERNAQLLRLPMFLLELGLKLLELRQLRLL